MVHGQLLRWFLSRPSLWFAHRSEKRPQRRMRQRQIEADQQTARSRAQDAAASKYAGPARRRHHWSGRSRVRGGPAWFPSASQRASDEPSSAAPALATTWSPASAPFASRPTRRTLRSARRRGSRAAIGPERLDDRRVLQGPVAIAIGPPGPGPAKHEHGPVMMAMKLSGDGRRPAARATIHFFMLVPLPRPAAPRIRRVSSTDEDRI